MPGAIEQREFVLDNRFKPAGDQPQAIEALVAGLKAGKRHQVLMGVTGSGKTFTMANVIQAMQKPTLVLSHNKTLAAQLYSEFKGFFPTNAVHYYCQLLRFTISRKLIFRSATFTSRKMRRSTKRSIAFDWPPPVHSSPVPTW